MTTRLAQQRTTMRSDIKIVNECLYQTNTNTAATNYCSNDRTVDTTRLHSKAMKHIIIGPDFQAESDSLISCYLRQSGISQAPKRWQIVMRHKNSEHRQPNAIIFLNANEKDHVATNAFVEIKHNKLFIYNLSSPTKI